MGVTYDLCGPATQGLILKAMALYHPALNEAEVTVGALFAEKIDKETGAVEHALFTRGQPVAAKISITPLPDRVCGLADAKLIIDREAWEALSESRRLALLDHELQHLELIAELRDGSHPVAADGKTARDDAGRPKFKLRHHEWEIAGFRAVVERHGEASCEAAQFRAFEDKYGQLAMFGPALKAP